MTLEVKTLEEELIQFQSQKPRLEWCMMT